MEAQIFKALGDPVRLEMVRRLAVGTPYTMGALTRDLHISRQGARKQVQVLAAAKVIRLEPKGRVVQVTLDMDALRRSKEFIAQLEAQWDKRLSRLKEVVEKEKV